MAGINQNQKPSNSNSRNGLLQRQQLGVEASNVPSNRGDVPGLDRGQNSLRRLETTFRQVWSELSARAKESGFVELLIQVFPSANRQDVEALAERLKNGDQLGLKVGLKTSQELQGELGSYAANGDKGTPTISVNTDLARNATEAELRGVLIEQIGQAFVPLLNVNSGSEQESGKRFSQLFGQWLNSKANPEQVGNQIASNTTAAQAKLEQSLAGLPEPKSSQGNSPAPGSGNNTGVQTVTTDKSDYSPGETVTITATGFGQGNAVRFSLADNPKAPGVDGKTDNYGSFVVQDGGQGDLDGKKDGSITATWTVPQRTDNPSAEGATINLTAQQVTAGKDGKLGTKDDIAVGLCAETSFRDLAAATEIKPTTAVVTLDETAGLQNSTPDTSDNDSNDIRTDSKNPNFPDSFKTRLSNLGFEPSTAINGALSGYDGSNTGLDMFTVSGGTLDLAFTDEAGDPLKGLDSKLQTVTRKKIFLFTDTDNNIVLGRASTLQGSDGKPVADEKGAIVFAAYIEETTTGGKIWTILYEPLNNPDNTDPDDAVSLAGTLFVGATTQQEFTFANAPSGQNLFLMLGDPQPDRLGIVVTGKNPADQSPADKLEGASINTGDTINTSQGGGSTTIGVNNQLIDPGPNGVGEGIYITFVTSPSQDFTIPRLDQNEADLEDNIQFTALHNTKSAGFTISQTQPSGGTSTIRLLGKVTASQPGAKFIPANSAEAYEQEPSVSIATVIVRNAIGQVITKGNGVSVESREDGSAIISGLRTGYSVEYTTSINHNRILIENAGNQSSASFDIGAFRLLGSAASTIEIGSLIRFEDDGPLAIADTGSVTEGATTKGTVLSNDSSGADGWPLTGAVVGVIKGVTTTNPENNQVSQAIAGDFGTLTLNADGTYTYVAIPDKINANSVDVFTYTVRDGDGDLTSTTLTINVSAITLSPDNATVTVNEAALDGIGSNPNSPDETAAGQLNVVNATSYALLSNAAGQYGTLTLNPNGSYSYTLNQPMNSGAVAGANIVNAAETFTYTATDANSNSVNGTITVNIIDDVPTILSKDSDSTASIDVPYNPNSSGVSKGGLDLASWIFGADGAASPNSFSITNLTTGYTPSSVSLTPDGKATFSISKTGSPSPLLEFILDPTRGANDTITYYKLTGTSSPTIIGGSLSTPGGPTAVLVNLPSAEVSVAVTGDNGSTSGGPNADLPNASGNGWGVGNQNIDSSERIRFAFYDLGATINGSTGVVDGTEEAVQSFQFTATKYTGSGTAADMNVSITFAGDSKNIVKEFPLEDIPENSVIRVDSTGIYVNNVPRGTAPEGAKGILSIDIFNPGTEKSFNVEAPTIIAIIEDAPDNSLDFDLKVTDKDGDVSSPLTVSVTMDGNDPGGISDVVVAPISLDLDRSSAVEHLSSANDVNFDYGWGMVATPWVAAQDGLLAYDYNSDSLITEAKEFVFTMWGTNPNVSTDMQALAAYFDSNKDLVLNKLDEGWSKFGVWQDINTDGVQQEGEFYDLAYWGIESIALSYNADSQAYLAADGDVQVHGQMAVSYADGTKGLAEDMAFAVAAQPTELATTSQPEQPTCDPLTGLGSDPGVGMPASEPSDPLSCPVANTACDSLTGFFEPYQATQAMLQQLFTALETEWPGFQGCFSSSTNDGQWQDIFNQHNQFAGNLQFLIERQCNSTMTL